jgi:hypothetical protein
MQLWEFRVTVVIQWSLILTPILYSLVFLVFSARAVVSLVIPLDLQEQLLSETGYEMKPVCRSHENKVQLAVIKKIIK